MLRVWGLHARLSFRCATHRLSEDRRAISLPAAQGATWSARHDLAHAVVAQRREARSEVARPGTRDHMLAPLLGGADRQRVALAEPPQRLHQLGQLSGVGRPHRDPNDRLHTAGPSHDDMHTRVADGASLQDVPLGPPDGDDVAARDHKLVWKQCRGVAQHQRHPLHAPAVLHVVGHAAPCGQRAHGAARLPEAPNLHQAPLLQGPAEDPAQGVDPLAEHGQQPRDVAHQRALRVAGAHGLGGGILGEASVHVLGPVLLGLLRRG
mmetsp:Transcript_16335/g.57061  ORF Transcript_16335/g.57061 Transcript_16335/m.57061 type:complete len:265 (-) Transcript_16335:2260-3054(-)